MVLEMRMMVLLIIVMMMLIMVLVMKTMAAALGLLVDIRNRKQLFPEDGAVPCGVRTVYSTYSTVPGPTYSTVLTYVPVCVSHYCILYYSRYVSPEALMLLKAPQDSCNKWC